MNNVTRMPSLGAGRLAKSIPGTGSVMKLLLGSPVSEKSRVLTQQHLTATDSRASTIQWIGFLNDLFYGRSYIAAPAEFQFLLDEKSAVVPVRLAGEQSGGTRKGSYGDARWNSERAAPSACVGRRLLLLRSAGLNQLDAAAHQAGRGAGAITRTATA